MFKFFLLFLTSFVVSFLILEYAERPPARPDAVAALPEPARSQAPAAEAQSAAGPPPALLLAAQEIELEFALKHETDDAKRAAIQVDIETIRQSRFSIYQRPSKGPTP